MTKNNLNRFQVSWWSCMWLLMWNCKTSTSFSTIIITILLDLSNNISVIYYDSFSLAVIPGCIESFWQNISLKNILQKLVSQATVLALVRFYKYASRWAGAVWSGIIYIVLFLFYFFNVLHVHPPTHISLAFHLKVHVKIF